MLHTPRRYAGAAVRSQFAIVNANGASGVRFQNQQGIQTDWLGNAVIPSLTPYQENAIRIDTASLPENVESSDTSIRVILHVMPPLKADSMRTLVIEC